MTQYTPLTHPSQTPHTPSHTPHTLLTPLSQPYTPLRSRTPQTPLAHPWHDTPLTNPSHTTYPSHTLKNPPHTLAHPSQTETPLTPYLIFQHSDRGSIKSTSSTPSIIHDTNAMMSYSNISLESETDIIFDKCTTYRTNSQQTCSPYSLNVGQQTSLNSSPDSSSSYSPNISNTLTNSEDLSSEVW